MFSAVAAAFLFGADGTAQAAPAGCAALTGSFSDGAVTGRTAGQTFSTGDTITLTVTAVGDGDRLGLYNNTTHTPIVPSFNTAGSQTYVVPADTTDEFIISGTRANAGSSFSWSCATGSGGGSGGSTDSEKLTEVQDQGSTVVANTSAANISGSVNSEIDDALEDSGDDTTGTPDFFTREEFADFMGRRGARGGGPEHGGPSKRVYDYYYRNALLSYDSMIARGQAPVRTSSGYAVVKAPASASQFVAERRSDVSRRVEQAFAPLGYGPIDKAPSFPALAVRAPQWRAWADVRGSGFRNSSSNGLNGTQINFTAGLTYRVRPGVVVGLFGGYENFNYEFTSVTGRLKGDGGTIGTYAGWEITPTMRWKGMVGWTGLGYDASAGTASGGFGGSRWLLSTGLTGSHSFGGYLFEPSADVFAVWERQGAYTDSLGALHGARNFSTGRVALGGKVSATQWAAGVTPSLGLYGDWRFASNASAPSAEIGDGWSARVTGGINIGVLAAGSLSLGGEYGGIGANYKMWTGNARLTLPF